MPKWKDLGEILDQNGENSASSYFEQQQRLYMANRKMHRKVYEEIGKISSARRPEPTFEDVFEDIFKEAFDLLVERQRKYGPENISGQGLYGIITRIADDKISRVRTAMNGQVVNGKVVINPIEDREAEDTFEDALLDIANYALIALALKRGLWGKPLRAPVAQRKERLPSKQ